MTLAQYTEPSLLVPRLLSDYRDSAIAELGSRLEKAGRIENTRAFTHAVLDHESFVSAWGLGKAPTVHAVVLFAVPLSAGQPYLSLVVTFSRFLQDQTAFSALRQCAQPEEMFAALKRVRLRRTGPQLAVAQP